jgi:hypothetical protein
MRARSSYGNAHRVGGHAVEAFNNAKRDGVFVSALAAHDADGLPRRQDGERNAAPAESFSSPSTTLYRLQLYRA